MENKFYVYVYMDPTKRGSFAYDGLDFSFLYEPFYIGKGHAKRDVAHLQNYRLKKKTYLSNKINKLLRNNIEPIIIRLYDNLIEDESFTKEILLIDCIGRKCKNTGPLVNIIDGGTGVTGLTHTEESRKKMGSKGSCHPNWGKHLKESTKRKIADKLKINNPMYNPDVVEKVRRKNLGKIPWNKGKTENRPDVISKLSKKKQKYFNIKVISKKNNEEIFKFNTTAEVAAFLDKTYTMVLIYFKKGESQDYYLKYDELCY